MADKMMRVAGRTSGGTAVPMLADSSGNVSTVRSWKKEWVTLMRDEEIRDTDQHNATALDVRNIPMLSLRITNRLGVPVNFWLLTDVNTSNGYSLVDENMVAKSFTIQPGNSYAVITPEDLPILNYVQYLRIAAKATSTPSSGTLAIHAVTMK